MTVLTDRYTAQLVAIESGLRRAVERLGPPTDRIAAYHFGWVDPDGSPADGGAGKALRPLLTLLAAKTVADDWQSAVPAAVAVELVHNFSLIHDDIIDRDERRRHRPTVWKVFGVDEAVLVGDALHSLAFAVIADADAGRARAGGSLLAATVLDLIRGQFADIRFEARATVGLDECTTMSADKTASLMGCATSIGALYAGGTPAQVEALRDFGFRLGLAFQHVDDLLGIWGDPAATGKAVYSDLRNRKKSLPVTAALRSGRPEADELAGIYRRADPIDEDELRRAADLVETCGGRSASEEAAETLIRSAAGGLAARGLDAEAVAELSGVATDTVRRDR